MKDFVKINETRIRKNTIKRFSPVGDTKVNVYFNTSRYRVDVETFDLKTKKARKDVLDLLDSLL